MNKTFSRWYTIILYEEDINYNKYIENLKKYYHIYAYIYHNKDIDIETKETKKPHYHYIINVGKNPERITTFSKTTTIPQNYIEGCNKDNMLLYLIHYKEQEKYQYNIEDVQGEGKERLKMLIENDNEEKDEKLQKILYAIKEKQITNTYELLLFGINNNCTKEIKTMQYLLCKIIQENVTNSLQNEKIYCKELLYMIEPKHKGAKG